MVVVDVVPKDIHILIDHRLGELKYLMTIMDNMQFNFDGNDPEHVEAKDYLENTFYPMVKKLTEDGTDGP